MRFFWHDEALCEYADAARYYNREENGLGGRFIGCVEAAIESICERPKMCPVIDDGVRRKVTATFPYSIIYQEVNGLLMIVAVMHDSREPEYWKDRL